MDGSPEVPKRIDLADVQKAHQILHAPGQQVEIRVLIKDGYSMLGRFDNVAKMFEWLLAADHDPNVTAIWWTIQELSPESAPNNLERRYGSKNESMARRRWIFVDVDRAKKKDAPASNDRPASGEELAALESRFQVVLGWLEEHGITPSLTAMSGNGYHLFVPVDNWPNDAEHENLAKAFIRTLNTKFSDEKVNIDVATAHAGRLAKVPGTVSRKGDETSERPYRVSHVVNASEAAPHTAGQIRILVEAEGVVIKPAKPKKKRGGLDPEFDIEQFAEWCDVTVEADFEKNGMTYYAVDPCPMAGHTHRGQLGKTCFIVGDSLGFECFSDDCCDFTISDVLRKFNEESGRYDGPLFLEPDMSDKFPVDWVDNVATVEAPELVGDQRNGDGEEEKDDDCEIEEDSPEEVVADQEHSPATQPPATPPTSTSCDTSGEAGDGELLGYLLPQFLLQGQVSYGSLT